MSEDFREVWWIFSPLEQNWAGLRIAHFRKAVDGTLLVSISDEILSDRRGVRVWDDICEREGWVRVQQIAIPLVVK